MKTKQRKFGRKLLSFLLTLAMVLELMPGMSLTAYAASATYVDGSGESKTVDATELEAATTNWTDGSWYIVPAGNLTISGRITVNGTVNLILRDGATLTASAGIRTTGATLNIYAQSAGTGALTAKGSNGNRTEGGSAGIGGNGKAGTLDGGYPLAGAGGTVNIYGGAVTATGGNGGQYSGGGAGIGGGGLGWRSTGGGCGTVSIYGGTVTATGGSGMNTAPGIGGGAAGYASSAGATGTLTLGAGVKLYNGTDNTGTVLDESDSTERPYNGSRPQNMFATGPDKSALNEAITAAETLYDSIKNNNDYSDIATTLSNAIEAAYDVADSKTADQDAIDAATTAITTAKTNAEAAKKDVDDTTEANKVSDLIKDLPSKEAVTKNDKTAIDAAKAAFDALTDDQKEKVSDADKQILNDAVAAIEAIEKDEAAAKAVSDKIAALPAKDAVTKDNKEAIDAAKAAYDALTDDQKKKVSDADKQKLSDAVAAIEAIENDKADAEAVQTVSDKIAALPAKDAVTKDDKAAINAAKEAFDALTDDQKKMVSEADRQKLDDAVAALAAIDGEGNTPAPTPVPVANVSGNDTVSIKKLELNVKGAQTLSVGEEATIKAAVTGKGSDASLNSVNWVAPSGHVVVTEVQADGSLKVKAVGPGTAFVTAVCGGKAKTVKYTVKQPVNKAEASLNAITLSVKEKYRICVNLDAPTTDKFFYATNDKKVCTVNGKGIIAAKGGGTTTVDILAGEKKNTAKKVASITVIVKEGAAAAVEVKDVSINYVGNKTLYTGEMAYISTLVNGGANNGGQAVKYSFSNKGIVKIDAYGRLTAKKAGKVTVTASCGGKEASVELTVQQPLKTLKVNKTYVKVKQGKAKTVTLSVKTSPALNKSDIKAVWSVANEGNGVKKISDENGKAVFEVSDAAKDTVVTATVTDPVTGRIYTVNSVIDVN